MSFGGYTNLTPKLTLVQKSQLNANIEKLKALIPDPAAGKSAPHTDFDLVHPETARKLRAEIAALKSAIDAAPST